MKGIADPKADYGNGYYNDHHFHYGYFIYTAAVIGKADSDWINQNQAAILSLVRDIINPSNSDPNFTPLRHTDFFRGNAWANWSTKVDFFSFFGHYPEYSFGIEALPVTPIAEALVNPE